MIGPSFLVHATIQSIDAKDLFSVSAPASAIHPYNKIYIGLRGFSGSFMHFVEKRETSLICILYTIY